MKNIVNDFEGDVPSYLGAAFRAMKWTIRLQHPEHYHEIEGIAETLDVDPNSMFVLNYMYELTSFCTSVVARTANGTIIH